MRSHMPFGTRAALVVAGIAAAFAALPSSASAQSLFGSRGLGVVVAPTDGRGAALGGLGVALPGPSSALLNPADAGDVNRRGVILAIQPSTTELETAEGSDNVSATRFPLVQLLLPIGNRTVLSAGYGAFLDQNWGVTASGLAPLGDDTVTAIDRISSRGGIAQARVGAAFELTEDLTLGAAIGLLTGSSTRTVLRAFVDDDIGLSPFQTEVKSTYNAPLAAAGVRYQVGSSVLVGVGVTWMGDLTATETSQSSSPDNPDAESETETRISMPLQVAGGVSAALLDDLLIVVNTRWTGWSASENLENATADDVIELGGGVEWSGINTMRRTFPVRLGARWGGQPFSFEGEAPSESAFIFGLGGRLAGSEEIPAALVDFAIERGSRGDVSHNGIGETFWRATVSVSLFSQ